MFEGIEGSEDILVNRKLGSRIEEEEDSKLSDSVV